MMCDRRFPKLWYKHYAKLDDRIPPDRLRHEAISLGSPFNQLEGIGAIERRLVPLERLVGRALSMSTTSPDQLGSDRLAQELLEQMRQFATDGAVVEVIETQALIARPGGGTDAISQS
jgi:hypothetical protein